MIGAQTIGNATIVAYDNIPVLSTDPWLGKDHYAYFGSWYLPYDIPDNINADILKSKYIFFSHGHPDHLNPDSFHRFKNNTILLGDHVGKRILNDLKSQGYSVQILKDKVWTELSKNISVMSVSTKIQDTILIVKIKDDIFINLNDAGPINYRFIKKIVEKFKRKFLLSISGWGDADMINFYDKDNNFIEPLASKKHPVGDYLSLIAKLVSANFVIPFSSFHEYQREDSIWANKYVTPIQEYKNGIHKDITYIEPFAFINCEKEGDIKSLEIKKGQLKIKNANEFSDNWNENLEIEEKKIINNYFHKFEELQNNIGFINFVVGKKDFNIKMKGPINKGITFEVPRNSLVEACRYNIFDDLLIGNFMKTKLYNLSNLYDPKINFNAIVCKYGDNGLAYSKEELIEYEKKYAKRMGMEYFYEMFANKSKNYFQYFFKNYRNSKYYTKLRKYYYYVFR